MELEAIKKRMRRRKIGAAIGAVVGTGLGLGLTGLAGAYAYKKRDKILTKIGEKGYTIANNLGSKKGRNFFKRVMMKGDSISLKRYLRADGYY
jgi:hypothetical protein